MSEAGRRVGAYQLVERLDAASGTEFWSAHRVDADLGGPHQVVIRLVPDADDGVALDLLRREHEDLRGLGDSRIPKVIGFQEAQRALILEHTPGTPLDEVIQAVSHGELVLDATTAVDIILEVAHGLRHAHSIVRPEGKIVHGHVTPRQIVLTPDGDVRVLGIGSTPEELDPRYMPAELAGRGSPDERTDQWQVGALLYELITRQPLYKGPWSEARRAATLGDVTPQLDRLESRYPALTQVLRKVLATQPSGRYQVESTFLRALLTASRSVAGKSRRRALGAESARIEPILRPVEPAPAASHPPGWSRVGASAEASGPLVFDPGDTGEQSDYELAEQMATDSPDTGMSWVDLPEQDYTPLPDLFARPKPATVRVPTLARGRLSSSSPPPAVNRPRSAARRPAASPIISAVSAPEPRAAPQIRVVDSLSLRSDPMIVRTREDLPEARVDDLRSILGGGGLAVSPRGGASVQLSVLRVEPEGTAPPMRDSLPTLADDEDDLDMESSHGMDLSADTASTVFAGRLPKMEPTAMISGRKKVHIERGWDDTPTDPGVRRSELLANPGLQDPTTDLQVALDAFGMGPAMASQDPQPTAADLGGSTVPDTVDQIQWGLFLAASAMGCLTLWALVFIG